MCTSRKHNGCALSQTSAWNRSGGYPWFCFDHSLWVGLCRIARRCPRDEAIPSAHSVRRSAVAMLLKDGPRERASVCADRRSKSHHLSRSQRYCNTIVKSSKLATCRRAILSPSREHDPCPMSSALAVSVLASSSWTLVWPWRPFCSFRALQRLRASE